MAASVPPAERIEASKELLESCRKLVRIAGGIPPQFSKVPYPRRSDSESPPRSPVARWVHVPFTVPSRSDGLQLKHWQRENAPYPFAKVGKKLEVVRYSEEEYKELVAEINPSWSKEETDLLFQLCEDFELRFIVIADRFAQHTEYKRSIEELKDRYFSIAKRLLESRGDVNNQLVKKPFNFNYEVRRKINLEKIFLRTAEHQTFERQILEEVKKSEQSIIKEEREQRNLLRLISKETKLDGEPEINHKGLLRSPKIPFRSNREPKMEGMQFPGVNLDAFNPEGNKDNQRVSGVYLRSQLMTTRLPIPDKAHRKLDQIVKELGVPERLMPTKNVVALYDQLRKEILAFLGIEMHIKKKEKEVETLAQKYEELQKRLKNIPPAAQMHSSQAMNPRMMAHGGAHMMTPGAMPYSPNMPPGRMQPMPNPGFSQPYANPMRYSVPPHARPMPQQMRPGYENDKTEEGSVAPNLGHIRVVPMTGHAAVDAHSAGHRSEPSGAVEPSVPAAVKSEAKHEEKAEAAPAGRSKGKRKARNERRGKKASQDDVPDGSSEKKRKKY